MERDVKQQMAKIKEFFKRKDVTLSLHRYGIDALGAMAHSVGQMAVAVAVTGTPGLLTAYLLPLEGIGAAVGCVTGAAAWRVIRAVAGRREGSERDGEGA